MKRIITLTIALQIWVIGYSDPSSDAIVKKKYAHLEIKQLGQKLLITETNKVIKEFYRNFNKHSRQSIFYSDFDFLTEFSAETQVPFKTKYKSFKVTNTDTEDIVQPGIFYGGYKRLNYNYSNLTQNSRGITTYTKEITDPHIISPFYFIDRYPIEKAVYEVSFPKTVKVSYRLFGEDLDEIVFEEIEEKNRVIYRWTYENIERYDYEKLAPSRTYQAPHIAILIESFAHKSKVHKILSNTQDLYNWYSSLIQKIEPYDKELLTKKASEIINNKETHQSDEEAIFKWVQKNIKYVAFEDGMAGFIPRSPVDVLTKRYGDCKDMANLLKEMLNAVDVDAYLAWIGTRKKPYSYSDLPCTVADNHMICAVKEKEKFLFLDATSPYGAFGQPTSMIQGKEALIGINQDKFKIENVPVLNPKENIQINKTQLKLDDKVLSGDFNSTLTGYRKNDFEYAHLKAEIRNKTEYMQQFFSIGSDDTEFIQSDIQGLGNQYDTCKISIEIRIPQGVRKIGKRIYVNLNLRRKLPSEKVDAKLRKSKIEEDYKYTFVSEVVFDIPEDLKIVYLPENKAQKWDHFEVSAVYKQSENTITYRKQYTSNFLYLEKEDFIHYNNSLEALSAINQESIILELR